MPNNTVKLHRVLPASPEKVYRAFTEPAAMASWLPPYGFVCEVHQMEVEKGGKYRMSFINFTSGKKHSFFGEYLDLKPNELLKYSDQFDDPNLPGVMITTVTIKKVSVGTEIGIVQENLPDAIPVDGCYLGWQDSLDKLKRLVEPNIPDDL